MKKNFETEFTIKEFKDIPNKGDFFFEEEEGKLLSYRKKATNLFGGTAVDKNGNIKNFSNYEKVLVVVPPKFILNY